VTKFCGSCGEPVVGTQFCTECGERLAPGATGTTRGGEAPSPEPPAPAGPTSDSAVGRISVESVPPDWFGEGGWRTSAGVLAAPHSHPDPVYRAAFPNPCEAALKKKETFEELFQGSATAVPEVTRKRMKVLLGRRVPMDVVWSYEAFCPQCCFGTVHDQTKLILGKWFGVKEPFGRWSTGGKRGEVSVWGICRVCMRMTPDDDIAISVRANEGAPLWVAGRGLAELGHSVAAEAESFEQAKQELLEDLAHAIAMFRRSSFGDPYLEEFEDMARFVENQRGPFSARVASIEDETRIWILDGETALLCGAAAWGDPFWLTYTLNQPQT